MTHMHGFRLHTMCWPPTTLHDTQTLSHTIKAGSLRPVCRRISLTHTHTHTHRQYIFELLICSVQEEQACATALILACSSAACDREVSQWATRAFFRSDHIVYIHTDLHLHCTQTKSSSSVVVVIRYGGEAQMRFPAAMTSPSTVGPVMSSPAPGKNQ